MAGERATLHEKNMCESPDPIRWAIAVPCFIMCGFFCFWMRLLERERPVSQPLLTCVASCVASA